MKGIMKCGCKAIVYTVPSEPWGFHNIEIKFCSLHAAAEDLLDECRKAVACIRDERPGTAAKVLKQVIAKAEGGAESAKEEL